MRSVFALFACCFPSTVFGQTILIEAAMPGGTAPEILDWIVRPLEQSIRGTDGVRRCASLSQAGRCVLWLDLKEKADVRATLLAVQNRVAQTAAMLPDSVNRTGITTRISGHKHWVLAVVHSVERDRVALSRLATQEIAPAFARADGVWHVRVIGEAYSEITPDAAKLAALGLTVGEIAKAIREQKIEVAAGTIGQPPIPGRSASFQVKALEHANLLDMIVAKKGERMVRLRDVASIGATGGGTVVGLGRADMQSFAVAVQVETTEEVNISAIAARLRGRLPEGVRLDTFSSGDGLCAHLRLPNETSLRSTEETAERAAKSLLAFPKTQVRWIATGNEAALYLSGIDDRNAILAKLREFRAVSTWLSRPRMPVDARPTDGADVVVRLQNKDERELLLQAIALMQRLNGTKTVSVRIEPRTEHVPAMAIRVDPDKLRASAGVRLSDVIAAIEMLNRKTPEEIAKIEVKDGNGKGVQLGALADIRTESQPVGIYREDGEPCLYLACTLLAGRAEVLERVHECVKGQGKGVTVIAD